MVANRISVAWAGALVSLATLAAYHNSLSGPLVMDDSLAIANNPSIRHLWPLPPVLDPPAECTVAGRPLANLSFALNFAVGGTAVWGYHAANLALHAGAALLLFGIVRRTLANVGTVDIGRGPTAANAADNSLFLATSIAVIWALHPLLTAAVSYISQRTEVLMTVWYVLTLYSFIRGATSVTRSWWVVSVASCWLGMGSKEGMVTAPVLVLIYDRCFVAGSFRTALALRWKYYGALAASWGFLAILMTGLHHRAVGFGLGLPWWRYALTESEAIITYVQLVLWPHPLIFDYGAIYPDDAVRLAFLAVAVAAGVVGAGWLCWRRPRVGFPFLAFFVILAPTSSVVPIAAQPIAENRVYLATAPVVALIVIGLFAMVGRRGAVAGLAAALALGLVTVQRNEVFRSRLRLWSDTMVKRPENARPFEILGEALFEAGRLPEARLRFEQALRLKPEFPEALNNLGFTLHRLGDTAGAIRAFQDAVRSKPDFFSARNNLGNALMQAGRLAEAQVQFQEALLLSKDDFRIVPDLPELHNSLGNALLYQGKTSEALGHYEAAARLRPDFPEARMNAGVALRLLGRLREAVGHLEAAVQLRADYPEAHYNLGMTWLQLGELEGGKRHLETAVRLRPDLGAAHQALGDLSLSQGKRDAAHVHYGAALQLSPNDANLRKLWTETGSSPKP